MLKEASSKFEDRETIAKMESNGSGPILGKKGRVESSYSSKKGKDRSKKQGNKMREEDGQEASVTDEPIP